MTTLKKNKAAGRRIICEEDLVDQLFNSSEKRLARTLLILANFGKDGGPQTITTRISQQDRHSRPVGGEEFAAALTETDLSRALQTAERLRRVVAEEPFDVGESRLRLTISVGVAARRGEDSDPGELLKLADRALYAAKAKGRNQVVADARQDGAAFDRLAALRSL